MIACGPRAQLHRLSPSPLSRSRRSWRSPTSPVSSSRWSACTASLRRALRSGSRGRGEFSDSP
eukprot:13698872-Alexandrium_andersonii.AAC.1